MSHSAIELTNVQFSYRLDGQMVPALNGISLQINRGEMVALQGPSGSGKSTLLYLLGCMLKPDSGKIRIWGRDLSEVGEVELAYFRNRMLGFVFQQFHLLPGADVIENILLPVQYPLEERSEPVSSYRGRAIDLAKQLGLGDRLSHLPKQLSGGQQQRVAIARALIRDAPLILADEPTGNLDSVASAEILKQLRELNRKGKTVVIITHDNEVAAQCDRVISIRDGKVQKESGAPATAVAASGGDELPPARLQPLDFLTLIRESAPRALENLSRNRIRSSLTMLGVIVGVASILAMLTLGTYTKAKILQSYASLGVNTLIFRAYPAWRLEAADRTGNIFTVLDIDRDLTPLRRVFPQVKRLSPMYEEWSPSAIYGGRIVNDEVNVFGVSEDGLPITRYELALGSGITAFHVSNRSSVCVIGFSLAQKLFQRRNPIGEVIKLVAQESTFGCAVIGVLKAIEGRNSKDSNMRAYVPYTVFQVLPFSWWSRQMRSVMLEVGLDDDVEKTSKEIQGYFKRRYGKSGDFHASGDTVLLAQMKRFLNLFTMLLVSIAGLSLVVGGMGITNMMLVSVNERFREIGLRKALGASHSAIRQLFFAESLLLCGVAGLLGVAVGFAGYELLIYLGTNLIPDLKFEWIFNPVAFFVSFVAILVTGVLSGLGPALRAEKLQVIEALRSE